MKTSNFLLCILLFSFACHSSQSEKNMENIISHGIWSSSLIKKMEKEKKEGYNPEQKLHFKNLRIVVENTITSERFQELIDKFDNCENLAFLLHKHYGEVNHTSFKAICIKEFKAESISLTYKLNEVTYSQKIIHNIKEIINKLELLKEPDFEKREISDTLVVSIYDKEQSSFNHYINVRFKKEKLNIIKELFD